MKKPTRWIALVLVMALAVPLIAQSAGSFYKKGKDAEARQDYVAAYDYYRQAYKLKPKDVSYRAAYERMRFEASSALVHRGQILRDMGKLEDALALFQQALAIDQASFIAAQEIQRTKDMIQKANSPTEPAPAPTSRLRNMVEQARGPVELVSVSDAPITLKLTEDTNVIYQTIGKLAGINVLFDPDYTARRIHIELNGVTLTEALELVAMESKTFWRAVTPNTIFVAADTPAKRKEIESNIIKTFYLSNLSQPTELQDVVNTLRTLLELQRITMIPSQAAIVIRGTPDQLAVADKLISDLDKARPEVVVDVAIMQVQREKIRNLGISPPTKASIGLQPNVTTTNGGTGGSGSQNADGTINLNNLGNLTAKDFVVTIPAATVNALFSDNNTKLMQNPQIRALDGQKASLKIGQRVPVATGSFGAGLTAGLGASALVNTQFQYIDVGVNIDITPKVHQNRDVSLKLVMDISAVTGNTDIGGIRQPIIGQNKIEHDIRLKEGEINLLGGLFEDVDSKTLSGLPGLSQIPLLKYLFSSESIDRRQNEIVMILVPHVVRSQDLTALNQRALDIGTGNVIDLKTMSQKAQPAVQPANAPVTPRPAPPGVPQQQPTPQPVTPPPAAPTPTPGAPVSLKLDVPQSQTVVGGTFPVNVILNGGQNIYSVPVQISYDPKTVELADVASGNFLGQDGQAVALVHRDDNATGTLQVTATRPPNAGGVSGSGTVFTLTFKAKAPGTAALNVVRAQVKDALMNNVPSVGTQAAVAIK